MKVTLEKNCIRIGELDFEPYVAKVLLDYWLINKLDFELSVVCVSQVNRPHVVIYKINFGSRLCPFGPWIFLVLESVFRALQPPDSQRFGLSSTVTYVVVLLRIVYSTPFVLIIGYRHH